MSVAALAELVGGQVVGEAHTIIAGVASLANAGEGEIAFLEDEKLIAEAERSGASCVIVPPHVEFAFPCLIKVARPKLAFALIARELYRAPPVQGGIHPTAVVAPSAAIDAEAHVGPYAQIGERAQIGARTSISAHCAIGADVYVGADSVLHPRVVLYDDVHIGERVILHAGVCVGADGFGYVRGADGYHKFPQLGTVSIADDVEIGAG
ncbi:MAG TPA: LpxD N-terminal domain-containing protein, partial [Pyrinomonadaceae bacterium]|nr:LpxD N-terminal domain-containing protein [Pyrinomonadaceae bacterium]